VCVYAFTRDKGAYGTLIVRKICAVCVCMHAHTQAEYEAVRAKKRKHLCMLEFICRHSHELNASSHSEMGEKLYDTIYLFALLLHEYADLFSTII
jgi:hypothetical protein